MKLLGATASHVGNVREANQDRVFFRGMVAALADGMGGHQGGERAAELAISEFRDAAAQLSENDLVELVMAANRHVHGHAADNGLPGMGTTLVAMTLHNDATITVANVGDSRAYWLRGDYMGQVTEDHSFVEDLVRQGRLTPEEAAIHPQRNILTRAVGIGAEVEVDRFPIHEPKVGDRFLLCSDGLFNELPEEVILEILLEAGDPAETADALIEATLQTPCRDNVTVAIVDLVEDDDPRLAAAIEIDADNGPDTIDEARIITAPIPVVSGAVLQEPNDGDDSSSTNGDGTGSSDDDADDADGVADDAGDADEMDDADDDGPTGSGPSGGRRAAGRSASAGGRASKAATATLLRDDADREDDADPELFLDTLELEIVDDEPHDVVVQPRSRLALAIGAVILIAGLAVGGYFGARTYARSGGFYVAAADVASADADAELVVFEGRRGGFLGFSPIRLDDTATPVANLDESLSELVDTERFDSKAEAMELIERIVDDQDAEAATQQDQASSGSSQGSSGDTSATNGG